MEKEVSSTPSEIIAISHEDDLVTSSICPRRSNQSIPIIDVTSRSWSGPLQTIQWTDLPNCMKFIAENGRITVRSRIWARPTLDLISSIATPEQLVHILNGYADLYKLILYFIKINSDIPVNQSDICTFGGTASNIEQQKRHRKIAYIMYNSENSLFTTFYATHSDSRPQTCFDTDDEKIMDNIVDLLRIWNQQTSQCGTQEIDRASENNDMTRNADGSQETDSLDALLQPESIAQNETVLTAPETCEHTTQHNSQTVTEFNVHSNNEEINLSLADPMATHRSSSSDTDLTEKIVRQNLDHMSELLNRAKRLQGETEDIPSVETADPQLPNDETMKEQESISQSGIIYRTKNKSKRTKKHVTSSNNNCSDAIICLIQSTTQPPTLSEQPTSVPEQLYDPPNVTKNPDRYRRVRMLTDVVEKKCPLVQAGGKKKQRSYPEIEVPNMEGIHCCVRAVTENNYPHPYTTVAPKDVSVKWELMKNNNERSCLQCNPDSFDSALEYAYLPITPQERQKGRKLIEIRLFNWKQHVPTAKEIIARENLRLCRLEFCLCRQLERGKYQVVSLPSYTTVIEEMDGDVTIDPNKIKPKKLCELGGEKIIVPLSVECKKKGFSIEYNGHKQGARKFKMGSKKLLITSPSKKEGDDELHLIIKRIEYIENTSTQKENQLYNDHLPFVAHGQCAPTCPHR